VEKTKALDIGKFTQICLDLEIEQDKQGNFGNALFVGELRKFISSFPAIEAVPLDMLCEWLADYAAPPGNASEDLSLLEHEARVKVWRYFWKKMMEGETKCTSTDTQP
jgi:hypothetical protein